MRKYLKGICIYSDGSAGDDTYRYCLDQVTISLSNSEGTELWQGPAQEIKHARLLPSFKAKFGNLLPLSSSSAAPEIGSLPLQLHVVGRCWDHWDDFPRSYNVDLEVTLEDCVNHIDATGVLSLSFNSLSYNKTALSYRASTILLTNNKVTASNEAKSGVDEETEAKTKNRPR